MERLTARREDGKAIYACSLRWQAENEQTILDRLAELEDKIDSGELIAKENLAQAVLEKIEPIIDELVQIGFEDSQCQVKNCHKPDKIQCGDGICIEENQKVWKSKVLEVLN